jgi:hypothetical protein
MNNKLKEEPQLSNINKKNGRSYEMQKRKDLLNIRRRNLKELYSRENENYEYEMISKNKQNNAKSDLRNPNPQQNKTEKNNYEEDYTHMVDGNIGKVTNLSNNQNFNKDNPISYNRRNERERNMSPHYSEQPLQNFTLQPKIMDQETYNNKFNSKFDKYLQDERFSINIELDNKIKKYNQNLEKLKLDDFNARKRIQDDLISKINFKLEQLNEGLNDKSFQEKLAQEWNSEREKRIKKQREESLMNQHQQNMNN